MNLNYHALLPKNFSPQSRVWIYQCSRRLTLPEALDVETFLENMIQEWLSHGHPVKGYANLFFGQFIVVIADETMNPVGGCSVDGSVRQLKQWSSRSGIDLFNRETLAFVVKDQIELLPLSQLQYAFDQGFITADTLYFNNLVTTFSELEAQWLIPVHQSWLSRRIQIKTLS
ncbi:MAG: hypothetical protein ACKO6K_10515 [Chitinophagaceae bacterium]